MQVRPHRARDSEATRAAILAAALHCFSENNYEAVGIREVASVAGVSGALVVRYFGSKEELFRLTLRKAFADLDMGRFFEGDLDKLGERMVRELLHVRFTQSLRATVRAAAGAQTAPLVRDLTEEYFCAPLAARLKGEQAAFRASLISAYMFGIAIHYYLVEITLLATEDVEAIVAQAARGVQPLITG